MAKLRWVETEPYTDRSVPVAMIPGYPESGPTYYKLQQWVDNPESGEDGEWANIEICANT